MIIQSGNILVLTQWSFKDALVQTYTLPYIQLIRNNLAKDKKIFLVTQEQGNLALTAEELPKINENWQEENIILIPEPYRPMGIAKVLASIRTVSTLYRLIGKEKISTIHCFCTPSGAIGFLLSKATGAKLIIDSYEPHAESMVENGTWRKKSIAFQFLFLLEKLQSKRAACFVSASEGMQHYAKKKYGIVSKKFFVKPACVDLNKFSLRTKDPQLLEDLQLDNKIVCVYAGKLGGIYLREEIFDFLFECYRYWGNRFRFLMLTNASRDEVLKEQLRVGLPECSIIQKFVQHEEVPNYLALGDFALNPVKPVPTKKYCTSLKDSEYWAMGLPVVITKNISDDSDIINRYEIGYVLKSLNSSEYKNAIAKIDELISCKKVTTHKARHIAEQYRGFQRAEKVYQEIYADPKRNRSIV